MLELSLMPVVTTLGGKHILISLLNDSRQKTMIPLIDFEGKRLVLFAVLPSW